MNSNIFPIFTKKEMKHLYFASIYLLFSLTLFAQQSTTGELPPEGIDITGHVSAKDANYLTYLIPDVPAYYWRYGCGPTALGMVLGYYDTHGYSSIFSGDASTQTAAVDQAIASTGHYNDYSLPLDYYPNLLPDLSEVPFGDEHPNNSIADFMNTSRSADGNYYGWSWSSDIVSSFEDYLSYATTYSGTCHTQYLSSFSFAAFMNEMNNNRPMMALVDTDGDGYTDHFITLVGYKQELGVDYYACYQTWDYTVHYYSWTEIASSHPWGIYCVYTFTMVPTSVSENLIQQIQVYPDPATNYIIVDNAAGKRAQILDIQGNVVIQSSISDNERIEVSSLKPGFYVLQIVSGESVEIGRFMVE